MGKTHGKIDTDRHARKDTIASMIFLETWDIYDNYTPPVESGMQPLFKLGETSYIKAVMKEPQILQSAARYMTMRVDMGATKPEFDGQGLGSQLREYAETHAYNLGYESITVEPISNATKHIYEKLQWGLHANVVLADEVAIDGATPFKGLKQEERFTIFMKHLRPSPVYSQPIAWLVLAALKMGFVRYRFIEGSGDYMM